MLSEWCWVSAGTQKVPALLDEVHRLIETRGLKFVLSGSSARKLRRGGVNLLAGRALVRHLFPLISAELSKQFDVNAAMVHGTLPLAIKGDDPPSYLVSYAVARALAGRVAYPPTEEERGTLLETLILNELRAFIGYERQHYQLHFWRSQGGVEVDFFCETSDGFVAIEVKASARWDKRYNRGLNRMRQELGQNRVSCYGVYLGERRATWDGIQVMPAADFLEQVWKGEVLR